MESLRKFVLSEQSVDGWINLKTALETESDMLEMAKTDKEDMVFYLTRQERQEIKRCRSYTCVGIRSFTYERSKLARN